ncbi:MAG: hypothetical protein IPP99_08335 [Chitinophagaceae bacterium]|nr:hypothetical protein [Chitinophagaceae bacterium]
MPDTIHIITATVCLYSGRINPSWTMTEEELDKLLLYIRSLPVINKPVETMMGYSGILIHSGPVRLEIFNEKIGLREDDVRTHYADLHRKLECDILKMAPNDLQDELRTGFRPVSGKKKVLSAELNVCFGVITAKPANHGGPFHL